ncbi:hypothetical protein BH10BAC2_BH10BAC2_21190 [soil metagenome]
MMKLLYIFSDSYKSLEGNVCCLVIFSFCLSCISGQVLSQEIKMNYNVKKGDKVIGTFTVAETNTAALKTIKLESHIKTSFIVSIAVDAKEESIFQNGVLSQSSVFRQVNGDEKVNKKHRFYGTGYVIEAGKKRDTLCCTQIVFNLMNLYCTEPISIGKVYSDNYQKFLVIQTTEPHIYRIDVPDGSYNKYFYKDGKCIKVEIHQSLYTIIMVLT